MTEKAILRDLPEQFYSRRLLIRAPRFGDGPVVNAAIAESFRELNEWMPWAQQMPTLEETEEHCRQGRARFLLRDDFQLLLFLKNGNVLAGCSGLHRIDWTVPKFEIGYWCRTSMTGQGLITEAVKAITGFAFDVLDAHRVEIRTDDNNQRSYRIPEKLGFMLEGTIRNDGRNNKGELRDTRVYSILHKQQLTTAGF
jgi:RimJ/RimL family protein N-acetyltransferase